MSDTSLPSTIVASSSASELDEGQSALPNIGRNRTLNSFVAALTIVSLVILGWTAFELVRGFSPTRPLGRIVSLLWFDLIVLVALATFIMVQGFYAWVDIRARLSGTQVYRRVVIFLVVVASLPTLLISVVAVLVLGFGIQTWFGGAVRDAVVNSADVATAYLDEHKTRINFQASRVADDFSVWEQPEWADNTEDIDVWLTWNTGVRGLRDASLITRDGTLIVKGSSTTEEELLSIPTEAFNFADERLPQRGIRVDARGEEISLAGSNVISVLIAIDSRYLGYVYLVATVPVDEAVLGRVDQSAEARRAYSNMAEAADSFRSIFALLFSVVALLLVILAGMAGLRFAIWLTIPILELNETASRLGTGDLSARVPVPDLERGGELTTLSQTFNSMAGQLQMQQQDLVQATNDAELRRRFSEAVLSGVSRGVIGLDAEARVNLPNRRANKLIDLELEDKIGQPLLDFLPMFEPLVELAKNEPATIHTEDVLYTRPDGKVRTFQASIVAELQNNEVFGFVLTFDDITEFLSAQRQAAWSDVARRIAHEIKNPLTPIQLSAERLKRRYLKQIDDRPDIFETCTDTIIGQVGDIARMVDEFSSFARMPAPRIDDHDIVDIARRVITLQGTAFEGVSLVDQTGVGPVRLSCDQQLVSQCLINLIKNSAEALQAAILDKHITDGKIRVAIETLPNGQTIITINDNGTGYPVELLPKLAEPYVTTREKGTGLGLAIVKKIMEDHGGTLALSNGEGAEDFPGAKAQMIFPAPSAPALETKSENAG